MVSAIGVRYNFEARWHCAGLKWGKQQRRVAVSYKASLALASFRGKVRGTAKPMFRGIFFHKTLVNGAPWTLKGV